MFKNTFGGILRKNGAEDLKKAKWYLERLIKLREFEEAMAKGN
jgi:hypothetical protein